MKYTLLDVSFYYFYLSYFSDYLYCFSDYLAKIILNLWYLYLKMKIDINETYAGTLSKLNSINLTVNPKYLDGTNLVLS